jgi:putative FmdB family regulatory protein
MNVTVSTETAFIVAAYQGLSETMPIFEYKCEDCGKRFEAIVIGSREPECPSCNSKELEQQLSTFAVKAHSSAATSMPCGAASGSCGAGSGGG